MVISLGFIKLKLTFAQEKFYANLGNFNIFSENGYELSKFTD